MTFDGHFRDSCILIFTLLSLPHARASILTAPTPTQTTWPTHHCLGVQDSPQLEPTRLRYAPELLVRQATTTSLATCGYINGVESSAVTCGSSLYCATTSTYVGCCEQNNCRDIFTSCYDLLGSTCDAACRANPQNLVCPSSLPYCAAYSYEGGSLGLGCASISGYSRTVFLTVGTAFGSLTTPTPTSTTSESSVPAGTSNNTSKSSSGGGLSTGATAGIAVGATLAGVALLGLAWFFIRRYKKNKSTSELAHQPETSKLDSGPTEDRTNRYSELSAKPVVSPTSTPHTSTYGHTGQPSPGFVGPPQYSQHYDGHAVEMPDNARPQSFAPTELSSNR